jgi:2-iminoacetate synthase ThiH
MAGSDEKNPVMTVNEMVNSVKKNGYIPVERDSLYNELKTY